MGLLKHNSLEFSGAVPSTSDVVMLKPHLRIGGTSQFLSLEVERLRSLPTFLLKVPHSLRVVFRVLFLRCKKNSSKPRFGFF